MELRQGRAIILRTLKYRDADLIVHVLMEDGSRHSLLARSAIKSKRRFGGGVLEPTHCVRISYKIDTKGDSDRLGDLLEASLENDFSGIRNSYQKIDLSLHFLRLVLAVTQEGMSGQAGVFNLLGHALKKVDASEDLSVLRAHFEAKLLAQQGVLPLDQDFQVYLQKSLSDSANLIVPEELKRRQRSRLNQILNSYLGWQD
jgi:DNA repair protein RecO (recombination protein O)